MIDSKGVFDVLLPRTGENPLTSVGDRVKLLHSNDPYSPTKTGMTGTVQFIDSTGTVHVQWDDGTTLGLIWDDDRWEII